MKSFKCYAFVAFFGFVAVQGYGPRRYHRHRVAPPKSSHKLHHEAPPMSSHEFHDESPHGPHHGTHHEPQHGPHHGHFGPPPPWDDSPKWDDRPDHWDTSSEKGSSDEDYYDDYYWPLHHHFHKKRPYKRPTKYPSPLKIPLDTNPPYSEETTQPTLGPETTRPVTKTSPSQTSDRPTLRPIRTVSTIPVPIELEDTTGNPNALTEGTTLPETTTSQEENTVSPEDLQNCIDTCITTAEFNPVCGTNGQTFDNEGSLFCAKSCGVDVSLRRRSLCPPPIFDFDYEEETPPSTPPAPPSPPPSTTNPPSVEPFTPFSSFHRCMKLCYLNPLFNPVCGTNHITYINIERMECAQSCGEVVEVLCKKPCAACGINPVSTATSTTTTTTTTTSGNIDRITLEANIKECIHACPMTPEYNPICGTDRVTYKNPGHLLCAQFCGVGVSAAQLSPCSPTTTSSLTSDINKFRITTLSPEVGRCIQSCPQTSEYNPICGSDNHTYNNMGHFECARFCGLNVEIKLKSRCLGEIHLPTKGVDSTVLATTQSIGGSKDTMKTSSRSTTTTTTRLTTPRTTQTSIQTTLTTTPSTIQTTLSFIIPTDILKDIFGSTNTERPPTTKPTNPDDDEDLNIDTRFNNDTEDNDGRIIFRE